MTDADSLVQIGDHEIGHQARVPDGDNTKETKDPTDIMNEITDPPTGKEHFPPRIGETSTILQPARRETGEKRATETMRTYLSAMKVVSIVIFEALMMIAFSFLALLPNCCFWVVRETSRWEIKVFDYLGLVVCAVVFLSIVALDKVLGWGIRLRRHAAAFLLAVAVVFSYSTKSFQF